jgi:hypothetical protein
MEEETAAADRPDVLPRPRRLLNTVIAVALLAELVALIGHPLFGWGPGKPTYAATPAALDYHQPLPPSGSAVLIRLADVAAQRSAVVPVPHGAYAYVRRQTWQLAPRRPGHSDRAPVIPAVIESWRRYLGGAGRAVTVVRNPRSGVVTTRTTSPSGGALPALSTSPVALVHRLETAAPPGSGPATGFFGLATMAAVEPIPPASEAAILRLLAHSPGVLNAGAVIDRAGRPGVAVSIDSNGPGQLVRSTLVFAPSTGALLEADETLIGDPQRSDLRQGAVLAYTTFLAAGRVDSPTARP